MLAAERVLRAELDNTRHAGLIDEIVGKEIGHA